MLTGLNPLTLAVSSLERSLTFYQQCLGMQCHARWHPGWKTVARNRIIRWFFILTQRLLMTITLCQQTLDMPASIIK